MAEKNVSQKLQMKAGKRVHLVNPPGNWPALLGEMPDCDIFVDDSTKQADIIVLFANNRAELDIFLPRLQETLAPGGMVWVVYHKGTSSVRTDIHRDSINAYAGTLGMTGVAMISINDDWSALRLRRA